MNHGDVTKNLADYLEGDLGLDDRALVDAHLDVCADCAREVSEMQETIQLLRGLPEPEPPPMIAANVMRRIRAGEAEPGLWGRIGRALRGIFEPSFVLPASAIAVAAALVVFMQGPVSIPGLGFMTSGAAGGSGAGIADADLRFGRAPAGQTAAVVAGLDREGRRAFGAPAAQDFLTGSRSGASHSPGFGGQGRGDTSIDPRARVRLEIARSARSGQARLGEPLRPSDLSGRYSGTYAASTPLSQGGGLVGGARTVAQPMAVARGAAVSGGQSSGGEDSRDQWIATGLEDPMGFARFIASRNLAEQELWVSRLSQRAEARGLLDDLIAALRAVGGAEALWVADDFEAQVTAFPGEVDRNVDGAVLRDSTARDREAVP